MQLVEGDISKASSADDPGKSPTVFAVLVHGTWARKAEWCRDNSDFCRDLRNHLAGPLKLDTFQWSGWNLHRARITAGSRLAARVISITSKHPDARIVLIGHSHGGNVIRYALRNVEIASRITGVVTLATPFIALAARAYKNWLYLITSAFAANAFVVAIALAGYLLVTAVFYVHVYFPHAPYKVILRQALIPTIAGMFYLLAWLYLNRIGRFITAIESKLAPLQDQMIIAIDPPLIEGIPLLSIEVRADEARFALRAASICSEWAYNTVSSPAFNGLMLFVLLPLATMNLLPNLASRDSDWVIPFFSDDWIGVYLMSLGVIFFVVPFLVGLLLFFSVLFPRTIKAPIFGEETLVQAWLLQSIQSAKPVGWTPHAHREFNVTARWWQSWRTLRHSLVYTNPEVVNCIANWVSELIADEYTGPVGVRSVSQDPPSPTNFEEAIYGVLPYPVRKYFNSEYPTPRA